MPEHGDIKDKQPKYTVIKYNYTSWQIIIFKSWAQTIHPLPQPKRGTAEKIYMFR